MERLPTDYYGRVIIRIEASACQLFEQLSDMRVAVSAELQEEHLATDAVTPPPEHKSSSGSQQLGQNRISANTQAFDVEPIMRWATNWIICLS
jgi:hypothetical protein